MAQALQEFT